MMTKHRMWIFLLCVISIAMSFVLANLAFLMPQHAVQLQAWVPEIQEDRPVSRPKNASHQEKPQGSRGPGSDKKNAVSPPPKEHGASAMFADRVATKPKTAFDRARERRVRFRPHYDRHADPTSVLQGLQNNKDYVLIQQKKQQKTCPVAHEWHEHVRWYCPTLRDKSFHRMLALDANQAIIANSNTFVSDPIYFAPGYEAKYGMMRGLSQTYQTMVKSWGLEHEVVAGHVVLVANTFSGTNSGHDLGIKLIILRTMLGLGLLDSPQSPRLFLFLDDLKFPRVMELVELFVPRDHWFVAEEERGYLLDQVLVVDVNNVNVLAECDNGLNGIIDEIGIRCAFFLLDKGIDLRPLEYRSVVLIKQRKHTSIRAEDAFYGNDFMQKAEQAGWFVVDPESLDMRYIVYLLLHASRILVSFGAIMWTHMSFFNPEAKVKYLQIDKNATAYIPVSTHRNYSVHQVDSVELDGHEDILDF